MHTDPVTTAINAAVLSDFEQLTASGLDDGQILLSTAADPITGAPLDDWHLSATEEVVSCAATHLREALEAAQRGQWTEAQQALAQRPLRYSPVNGFYYDDEIG